MAGNPKLPTLTDADCRLTETLSVLRKREVSSRRQLLQGLGAAAVMSFPLKALACSLIPSETAGPYPGDGSNGPNVLTQSGIVRSDIRSSFGASGTTTAAGTPLTVTLTLVNVNDNCAPLAGYAVYLWQCDAQGRYSMYSTGVTGQNYLRGVQVSDSAGKVTFTTIFPGAYAGRWPHIHFEVYANAQQAVAGANAVRISQLALPDAESRAVYAQTMLYPSSLANHNQTPLANDNVFGNDAGVLQLATMSGSVAAGFTAALEVGIAATVTSIAPDIDQHGLTGIWYEAATSGQGFGIEVYPDFPRAGVGFAQVSWFTFDSGGAGGADRQRWYTASGQVTTGNMSAALAIYQNTGGNFNAAPETTAQQVGTATLSFASCDTALFTYAFSDGSGRSGSIPLTRITPNVTCATTTPLPTDGDFGLSGNWYDTATSGQGFFFELNRNSPVFYFAWYTYAPGGQGSGAAGQRWYTGQTNYQPGARSFAMPIYETVGGLFDTATPPGQTTSVVGAATVTFSSCGGATLSYTFSGGSSAGRTGTIALTRVGPVGTGCVY